MNFQINALPETPFAPLFGMTDAELAKHQARRQLVTESPGVPCRVSLEDAKLGEHVVLCNYEHQPGDSPYQARHAVYVREGVKQAALAINEVPEVIRSRLLSLRCFSRDHMIVAAEVVAGDAVSDAILTAFENRDVAYIHLHFAKPGCFAASVDRVS